MHFVAANVLRCILIAVLYRINVSMVLHWELVPMIFHRVFDIQIQRTPFHIQSIWCMLEFD